MDFHKHILKEADAREIVFDYRPRVFPQQVEKPAREFISQQESKVSDFIISELVAKQTGIHELNRRGIEAQVEELALKKLKEIEEKAYSEAYELGLIEGTEKAFIERKDDFEDRVQQMDTLLERFEHLKSGLIVDNEKIIMKLIFMVASRIAMKEIKQDQENVFYIVKNIMEEIQSEEKITLHIALDDIAFITSLRDKLHKDTDFVERIRFEGSESIAPGGCLVETEYGTIDATLEQRLNKVWHSLKAKFPRSIDDTSKQIFAETMVDPELDPKKIDVDNKQIAQDQGSNNKNTLDMDSKTGPEEDGEEDGNDEGDQT